MLVIIFSDECFGFSAYRFWFIRDDFSREYGYQRTVAEQVVKDLLLHNFFWATDEFVDLKDYDHLHLTLVKKKCFQEGCRLFIIANDDDSKLRLENYNKITAKNKIYKKLNKPLMEKEEFSISSILESNYGIISLPIYWGYYGANIVAFNSLFFDTKQYISDFLLKNHIDVLDMSNDAEFFKHKLEIRGL